MMLIFCSSEDATLQHAAYVGRVRALVAQSPRKLELIRFVNLRISRAEYTLEVHLTGTLNLEQRLVCAYVNC